MVVKDRVIMVLVYYSTYITYTLTGFLFDPDQGNIYKDIQKIERLIRDCLPIPQKIYRITKRLKTREEVKQYFPDLMVVVDFTEHPIPRPDEKLKRRLYFSGKRGKHTVKNMYTVNEEGLISNQCLIKR